MPRLRLALSGTGPAENWGINNDFALTEAVPNLATLQAIATAIATALPTATAVLGAISIDQHITEVKLLHYPAFSGVSNLVATAAHAPIPGGAAATYTPQVCCVASLRTNQSGRSFRGRTYWPYRGTDIQPTGALTVPGQAIIGAASIGLANAVIAACATSSIGAAWGVYSPKLSLMTPVADVLVGTQCDTQRRRNVNRAETYAVTPYTPPTLMVPDSDALSIVQAAISHFLNQPIKLSDGIAAAEAIATVFAEVGE